MVYGFGFNSFGYGYNPYDHASQGAQPLHGQSNHSQNKPEPITKKKRSNIPIAIMTGLGIASVISIALFARSEIAKTIKAMGTKHYGGNAIETAEDVADEAAEQASKIANTLANTAETETLTLENDPLRYVISRAKGWFKPKQENNLNKNTTEVTKKGKIAATIEKIKSAFRSNSSATESVIDEANEHKKMMENHYASVRSFINSPFTQKVLERDAEKLIANSATFEVKP